MESLVEQFINVFPGFTVVWAYPEKICFRTPDSSNTTVIPTWFIREILGQIEFFDQSLAFDPDTSREDLADTIESVRDMFCLTK